tara:strand:+ start:264 stop:473 length:210 start_codon:yes stop_codon:yes gene_type:complete
MKKYKVKDLSKLATKQKMHELKDYVILIKKWEKNGVVRCKVESPSGYEYIVHADNLEEIKTKSNKKSKK